MLLIELRLLALSAVSAGFRMIEVEAFGRALSIPMRIEHVALWTRDTATLERLREFYESWFGATAGPRYESRRRPGFTSSFLTFPADGDSQGARLELMTAPDIGEGSRGDVTGWAHLAIALGTHAAV